MTTHEIITWIYDWASKNHSTEAPNISEFTSMLNGRIAQMEFVASNGGAAIGYAGFFGETSNTHSWITVESIVNNSNDKFSFINRLPRKLSQLKV